MSSTTPSMEVEKVRTYVIYDNESGAIVHVHRVTTHKGASSMSDDAALKQAVEMATRFGQRPETTSLIRADHFDSRIHQRVNVKTRALLETRGEAGRAE